MQVWLNDSEARASKISNEAYNLDCLKFALEDAIRQEMNAFDN